MVNIYNNVKERRLSETKYLNLKYFKKMCKKEDMESGYIEIHFDDEILKGYVFNFQDRFEIVRLIQEKYIKIINIDLFGKIDSEISESD